MLNMASSINSDNGVDLNWLVDTNPFMTMKANTNWSTNTVDAALVNNARLDSTGAQNAEFTVDVTVSPGTWTFELIHRTGTDRGIYSVQLDSVEVGTIDGYAASGTNNVRTSVTGVAIGVGGKRELKLKMATKNASSSSYLGTISGLQWKRTA